MFTPDKERRPFAVVTGASRGIGAAYARALAAQGFDLLLVARDRLRLEQLAAELGARHGIAASWESLDLSVPDASHRLLAAAIQRRPSTDLLVNNAGFGWHGPFLAMPLPRLRAMLTLHVTTVVESVRLFLPGMVERGCGAIINVASVAGFFPLPYMSEYAATKAFIIHFSQAVAEEVRGTGVIVQACCPGSTATDFHATAGYRALSPVGSQQADEVIAVSLSHLERGPQVLPTNWSGRLLQGLSALVPSGILVRQAKRWLDPARTSRDQRP